MLSIIALPAAAAAFESSPFRAASKPYPQVVTDADNVLKYMGDCGPYVNRRGYGINRDPPNNCEVEQAVFLFRHGERFPSEEDYAESYNILQRVLDNQGHLNGSLSFANTWQPVLENNSSLLETETTASLYSGLLDGFSNGVESRRRYYDLYDGSSQLKFYASNSTRVIDTAYTFALGFLNYNFTDFGDVVVIPEKNGANTLKPKCKLKKKNAPETTCKGGKTEGWVYPEFQRAADRLNAENPKLNFTAAEIPQVIYYIPTEIGQRGASLWVNAFTAEELVAFNYWVTSSLYCSDGPGSTTGPLAGQIFLNASRKLLVDGPDSVGPLTFTFTHHSSMLPILATLGIDELDGQWDPTEVHFGQRYDITDLTPMGARVVLERFRCPKPNYTSPEAAVASDEAFSVLKSSRDLAHQKFQHLPNSCKAVSGNGSSVNSTSSANATSSKNDDDVYVRLVINEAVVPLDGCSSGPGKSCQLADYDKLVTRRIGNTTFQEACKLDDDEPKYLSFFWDQ